MPLDGLKQLGFHLELFYAIEGFGEARDERVVDGEDVIGRAFIEQVDRRVLDTRVLNPL